MPLHLCVLVLTTVLGPACAPASAAPCNISDIDTHGDGNTIAYAMNSSGQAKGFSRHAFYYSNGVTTELNSLIAPGSGWTPVNTVGSNDSGRIIANAVNSQGQGNALRQTPALEPGSIVLMSVVVASLLLLRPRWAAFMR